MLPVVVALADTPDDSAGDEPVADDEAPDVDRVPDVDDADGDIPDVEDRCPDAPEDNNGFEDIDGCPEPAVEAHLSDPVSDP